MILFLYLLSMLCSKLLGSCFLITWYVLVCLLIILHYYHTPLQVRYFKMHWIDFLHNYLLVCCCLKTVYSFNKKYLKFLYYCDIRTYEQFFIWRIKHVNKVMSFKSCENKFKIPGGNTTCANVCIWNRHWEFGIRAYLFFLNQIFIIYSLQAFLFSPTQKFCI